MKKAIIISAAAVVAAAAIGITAFALSQKAAVSADIAEGSIEKLDSFEVETGTYYLNGDTSERYIEVTAGTVQILGADIEEYVRGLDDRMPYYDPETGERVHQEESSVKADIEKYSKPESYVVVCVNGADGSKTYILATSYYEEDKYINAAGYRYDPDKLVISAYGIDNYMLVK